jgi:hypothetical protein
VGKRYYKQGRHGNNDKLRDLRKRLESVERENKRLMKIINRIDLTAVEEKDAEPEKNLKAVEPAIRCPKCGLPAKAWKLPLRTGTKSYIICDRCGTMPQQ